MSIDLREHAKPDGYDYDTPEVQPQIGGMEIKGVARRRAFGRVLRRAVLARRAGGGLRTKLKKILPSRRNVPPQASTIHDWGGRIQVAAYFNSAAQFTTTR